MSQRNTRAVVAWWVIGGLFFLTFVILNKNVRYTVPTLPAVALITVSPFFWIRAAVWRVAFLILLGSISFPYYTHILFSWPPIHKEIGFSTGPLDWIVWEKDPSYGGLPSSQDWSITDIIFRMLSEKGGMNRENPIRLVIVPFLYRLNQNSLRLEALQSNIPLDVYQIGDDPGFSAESGILSSDFLLTKTGDLGLSFMTRQAGRIEDYVMNHPDRFKVLETYPFPDGSTGMLFKVIKQIEPVMQARKIGRAHV